MFCRKCNVSYPEDAIFCNVCGEPLEFAEQNRCKNCDLIAMAIFRAEAKYYIKREKYFDQ